MLGDWVNLMGHQKAAYDMLIRLYSPKTIIRSDFLLKVSLWYTRFDLFVGLQSGSEAVLSHDWYEAIHEFYAQKASEQPERPQTLATCSPRKAKGCSATESSWSKCR
jgi:hypothetical protein